MPTPISNNNVIDLNLPIEKRAFRFGQDDNRIVWINTSDLGFIHRLPEAYEKLEDLQTRVSKVTDGISEDDAEVMNSLKTVGTRLNELDSEMRVVIDELFNAPVSAAAAPDGSMYDLFDGVPRFDLILTVLVEQFGSRYTEEFKKVKNNVQKHTSKYKGKK